MKLQSCYSMQANTYSVFSVSRTIMQIRDVALILALCMRLTGGPCGYCGNGFLSPSQSVTGATKLVL